MLIFFSGLGTASSKAGYFLKVKGESALMKLILRGFKVSKQNSDFR